MPLASSFAGQNWLVTPAATAVNGVPPRTIADQRWIFVLSGVCIVDFQGVAQHDWNRETITIVPDISAPLQDTINRFGIPRPTNPNEPPVPAFNLEPNGWAPFAAPSSALDHGSTDFGFAVDVWRPTPFQHLKNVVTGTMADRIFSGIDIDIAIRNTNATFHRVSYQITLVGQIVFVPPMQ